jgi:Hydrazine synthase alpha subunit middle domain/WD40-like Beta Propeller Repeat
MRPIKFNSVVSFTLGRASAAQPNAEPTSERPGPDMMNIDRLCDLRHSLLRLAAAVVPLVAVACSSGVSGHAPGLAGMQGQDPGTFTYPLAYIKRPPPAVDIDARDLITPTPGGDLYVRAQASAGGLETNVTKPITGGTGDVRDLDVSPDGKKLVFALRQLDPKKNITDPKQPNWKIYQYDAVAKTVTQLTNDDTTAGHDVGPRYLPDGRIVFSSTRQVATQSILIDENRPQYPAQTDDRKQPIFLLHVMNGDGTDIHQISFNTNHDFAPSVLANGQIVFSRYESINGDQISLYRTNPDGTGLELYYGANSHASGANIAGTNDNVIQFLSARQRPDGKLLAIVRPFLGTQLGGDLVQIDAAGFVEMNQPASPGGAAGTAQTSATVLGATTDANLPSLGGHFASAYPLYDGTNRWLVSWAPCLVSDTSTSPATTTVCTSTTLGANTKLAPPQYTIWVYDVAAGTLSPVLAAESGTTIVEPVVLQARTPAPTFLPDFVPTGAAATLAGNSNGGIGLLVIRSVYDFDGVDTVPAQTAALGNPLANIAALADPRQATADQRPARFIRIEKAVEIPDKTVRKINNSAFGPANMGMREILAYAPIEPDGSVKIQVPANVPFTIDILDKNARRITARHTSWLQLMPGETKTCNGCHTAGNKSTPSHGRSGLTASVNAGALAAGSAFPDTLASLPAANVGDTMADTLSANTCQTAASATVACSQVPSIDVIYSDAWTDPNQAGRAPDTSFQYQYAALSTAKPNNAHCLPWDPLCRSTIHYPLHIQPLWQFARTTLAADGTVQSDHTCTNCHNPVNAANANAVQVPQGQLDLTASTSTVDITVLTSYEELLFAHNEQALNMGVLSDLLVPAPGPPGPGGAPTTVLVPVSLAPPLTAGSANNSVAKFLGIFDANYQDPNAGQPNEVDHRGFLTPAELRLISEWLDIGAQYYNDPFVAPVAN